MGIHFKYKQIIITVVDFHFERFDASDLSRNLDKAIEGCLAYNRLVVKKAEQQIIETVSDPQQQMQLVKHNVTSAEMEERGVLLPKSKIGIKDRLGHLGIITRC